jgi:hypothetical protein
VIRELKYKTYDDLLIALKNHGYKLHRVYDFPLFDEKMDEEFRLLMNIESLKTNVFRTYSENKKILHDIWLDNIYDKNDFCSLLLIQDNLNKEIDTLKL